MKRYPATVVILATLLATLLAVIVASCGSTALNRSQRVVDSVVHVSGVACSQPREGVGVDLGNGWILASGHVLDGMTAPEVIFGDGKRIDATVLHLDQTMDVGILELASGKTETPVQVIVTDADVGSTGVVHVIDAEGVRSAAEYTIDRKINARTLNVGREEEVLRPSLQLVASVDEDWLKLGDSGAALWDEQARMVGVVWAVSTSTDGRAFAVQGDEVAQVISDASSRPSGGLAC